MHFEMVNGAASVAAEDPGSVCVVHHHDRAVLLGEITKSRQWPNIAIHRKDAVTNQEFPSRLVFHAGQLGFSIGEVLVLEDENLRPREPRPVNDGSVIELI